MTCPTAPCLADEQHYKPNIDALRGACTFLQAEGAVRFGEDEVRIGVMIGEAMRDYDGNAFVNGFDLAWNNAMNLTLGIPDMMMAE